MRAIYVLWMGLLLIGRVAAGQSFAYRAELGQVPASGFYRVLLPPAITRHLQPGLTDIRLYSQYHHEVPYLLVREKPGPATPDLRYLPLANLSFRQYGSRQHQKTILRFSAPAPVHIDRLVFTIAAPALYHRQATLYQWQKRRGLRRHHKQVIAHFLLSADKDNILQLAGLRERQFEVEIHNGDSPPLVIKKVEAYQLPAYLVAALEKGQTYYLAFGSKQATPAPVYDLAYFQDRIPPQLATLQPRRIRLAAAQQADQPGFLALFFRSRLFLWVTLLAVIAFLGFMSYKILQETGKRR